MAENCPFDVTPLAISKPIRNVANVSLNYTNQDYGSLKTRLVEFIQQRFPNDFTDFVESSLAIMLLECWAFTADMLSFKIDQIANEVFIDTVREIENSFRLSDLVGFKPQPPVASTAMFVATINRIFAQDVLVPTPIAIQYVSDGESKQFEIFPADVENKPIFDADIRIPAGASSNSSVIGVEGQTITQIATAGGGPNQFVALDQFPVLWDSIRVKVDGVSWEKVELFTDSQPRREYRVEYASTYQAFVMFGNEKAGIMPSNGSQIEIVYRIGGGTAGNIVTGALTGAINIDVPGEPGITVVNFQNYTRGVGGYDGDTIDDVRRKLPAYLRTQDRAVTGMDYKTLCDQFVTAYSGQIGKAVAALRNHGCAGNIVDLYVLQRDGQDGLIIANDDLKFQLRQTLNQKQMFSDFVCIRNGVVIPVDVHLDLVLDRVYRKFEEEIKVRVNRRVTDFFSLNNWEYGQTLRTNDLIKALSDIRELSQINVTFVSLNMPADQEAPDACTPADQVVTARFYEIVRRQDTFVEFNYMSSEEL